MKRQETWAIVVALGTAATTVGLSMVLNSWAFTTVLNSWFGHVLGVLLPMWVLALTYMGHSLWPVERRLSIASYALAGFALVVSMPHLAAGYERLGLHWWECWSLAFVTDLAQVVAKLLVIALVDQQGQGQVAKEQTKVVSASERPYPSWLRRKAAALNIAQPGQRCRNSCDRRGWSSMLVSNRMSVVVSVLMQVVYQHRECRISFQFPVGKKVVGHPPSYRCRLFFCASRVSEFPASRFSVRA